MANLFKYANKVYRDLSLSWNTLKILIIFQCITQNDNYSLLGISEEFCFAADTFSTKPRRYSDVCLNVKSIVLRSIKFLNIYISSSSNALETVIFIEVMNNAWLFYMHFKIHISLSQTSLNFICKKQKCPHIWSLAKSTAAIRPL